MPVAIAYSSTFTPNVIAGFLLTLLGAVLWTGLRNAGRRLGLAHDTTGNGDDSLFETFAIAYILAYVVYNTTEATFQGLNFLFIIFLLLAFDVQRVWSDAEGYEIEQRNGGRAVTGWESIK
jgi:hypothetical protein